MQSSSPPHQAQLSAQIMPELPHLPCHTGDMPLPAHRQTRQCHNHQQYPDQSLAPATEVAAVIPLQPAVVACLLQQPQLWLRLGGAEQQPLAHKHRAEMLPPVLPCCRISLHILRRLSSALLLAMQCSPRMHHLSIGCRMMQWQMLTAQHLQVMRALLGHPQWQEHSQHMSFRPCKEGLKHQMHLCQHQTWRECRGHSDLPCLSTLSVGLPGCTSPQMQAHLLCTPTQLLLCRALMPYHTPLLQLRAPSQGERRWLNFSFHVFHIYVFSGQVVYC